MHLASLESYYQFKALINSYIKSLLFQDEGSTET